MLLMVVLFASSQGIVRRRASACGWPEPALVIRVRRA